MVKSLHIYSTCKESGGFLTYCAELMVVGCEKGAAFHFIVQMLGKGEALTR